MGWVPGDAAVLQMTCMGQLGRAMLTALGCALVFASACSKTLTFRADAQTSDVYARLAGDRDARQLLPRERAVLLVPRGAWVYASASQLDAPVRPVSLECQQRQSVCAADDRWVRGSARLFLPPGHAYVSLHCCEKEGRTLDANADHTFEADFVGGRAYAL